MSQTVEIEGTWVYHPEDPSVCFFLSSPLLLLSRLPSLCQTDPLPFDFHPSTTPQDPSSCLCFHPSTTPQDPSSCLCFILHSPISLVTPDRHIPVSRRPIGQTTPDAFVTFPVQSDPAHSASFLASHLAVPKDLAFRGFPWGILKFPISHFSSARRYDFTWYEDSIVTSYSYRVSRCCLMAI
jgi:hypothetical protein